MSTLARGSVVISPLAQRNPEKERERCERLPGRFHGIVERYAKPHAPGAIRSSMGLSKELSLVTFTVDDLVPLSGGSSGSNHGSGGSSSNHSKKDARPIRCNKGDEVEFSLAVDKAPPPSSRSRSGGSTANRDANHNHSHSHSRAVEVSCALRCELRCVPAHLCACAPVRLPVSALLRSPAFGL